MVMKKEKNDKNLFGEEQRKTIARTLTNLRELKFLKQTDIANYLHLTPGTISHYEKGITVPPTEVVYRLADFYGVTTDYILGRCASKNDLNSTYNMKLGNKATIGDAVEVMSKMTEQEKEHLAYFIMLIKNDQK